MYMFMYDEILLSYVDVFLHLLKGFDRGSARVYVGYCDK